MDLKIKRISQEKRLISGLTDNPPELSDKHQNEEVDCKNEVLDFDGDVACVHQVVVGVRGEIVDVPSGIDIQQNAVDNQVRNLENQMGAAQGNNALGEVVVVIFQEGFLSVVHAAAEHPQCHQTGQVQNDIWIQDVDKQLHVEPGAGLVRGSRRRDPAGAELVRLWKDLLHLVGPVCCQSWGEDDTHKQNWRNHFPQILGAGFARDMKVPVHQNHHDHQIPEVDSEFLQEIPDLAHDDTAPGLLEDIHPNPLRIELEHHRVGHEVHCVRQNQNQNVDSDWGFVQHSRWGDESCGHQIHDDANWEGRHTQNVLVHLVLFQWTAVVEFIHFVWSWDRGSNLWFGVCLFYVFLSVFTSHFV